MAKPTAEWVVRPHGPIQELAPGLAVVTGQLKMPIVDIPRRMTIVRLDDGRLILWSAIALDEPAMEKLQAMGEPAWLVVPSDHHRLDAAAYKYRFPGIEVVAPSGSRDKVADIVDVAPGMPDFGDPSVRMTTVAGTGEEEAALVVRRQGGATLVLNDVIGNIRHSSGFGGWVLRRMGFAGDEAQIPKTAALAIIEDKRQLAAQFDRWADELVDLRRIIVSHGDIIDVHPRDVLRQLSASLN